MDARTPLISFHELDRRQRPASRPLPHKRKEEASTRTCWASTLNRKLWNKRAALGLGALWKIRLER
jgi:hypothetical protein